ncbi:cora-domain-containing protein [Dissoconium aciculare CBS 342.82]|uniref:Cora-domain-containing protein n=1 Tax=Dissoconium aciculare CBS 342.82 TaxID=1314786 RepID=A0A6J3LPL5_9PEZI|nr:cora-domain-containing protein [Dissoconium aciculare CBS 342.82]KAF1817881.1 cora-domain-containing protein [Dissoconium aciculare CBS 342.82]
MAAAPRENLQKVAGPDSMAMPAPQQSSNASSSVPAVAASSSHIPPALADATSSTAPAKKKRHRAGRRHKKSRKLSIIAPSEDTESQMDTTERPGLLHLSRETIQQANLDRLRTRKGSSTSMESEALLDHRYQGPARSRGYSNHQNYLRNNRSQPRTPDVAGSRSATFGKSSYISSRGPEVAISDGEDDDAPDANDRTPLLRQQNRKYSKPALTRNSSARNHRRESAHSKASSRRRVNLSSSQNASEEIRDVNNPPSMPGSPTLGSYTDPFFPDIPADLGDRGRDVIINIEGGNAHRYSSNGPDGLRRRATTGDIAGLDVCFPADEESEYGEGEYDHGYGGEDHHSHHSQTRRRRRRNKEWPNFEILEDWVREEKEMRTEQETLRTKKIIESTMFGGRLRPRTFTNWRAEEDNSFRFAYFSEIFDTTIHAQNISNLLDDGNYTFQELFKPEFPDESESSESEEDEKDFHLMGHRSPPVSVNRSLLTSNPPSGQDTPKPNGKKTSSKRYGRRPTFWLDVRQPTPAEMQVLQDAFGIHRLTTEDIMTQDPRDKLELFQHYYFLNYRTFEQDKESENYMQPINLSMVVFQEGVISFHHSMIPHPNNVRRRIRQLRDYGAIPYADWISYALVDDVTDAYQPIVTQTEQDVDEIDEEILYMHRAAVVDSTKQNAQQNGKPAAPAPRRRRRHPRKEVLRRVGETRKDVMTLYRLLGAKADVVKSFAKRCNEVSRVGAPRADIGMYLSDIHDHVVTMSGNLTHYESLLSRAHSNYVAQINIRMNERAEQNADVLGKLTVLGTIVLPMNIITGMWGMNVWVPGQEYEGDLTWFWCITGGLVMFGVTCYFIAKRVYGIV